MEPVVAVSLRQRTIITERPPSCLDSQRVSKPKSQVSTKDFSSRRLLSETPNWNDFRTCEVVQLVWIIMLCQ